MKAKIKKFTLLSISLITIFLSGAVPQTTLAANCSASINFNIPNRLVSGSSLDVQGTVVFSNLVVVKKSSYGTESSIFVCQNGPNVQTDKFGISINDKVSGAQVAFYEIPFVLNQNSYSINKTVSANSLNSGPANLFAIVKVNFPGSGWENLTSSNPAIAIEVKKATADPPANDPKTTENNNQKNTGTDTGKQTNTGATGTKKDDKLYNPLPTDSLIDMFLFITKGFLSLLGAWAVIAIIIGGFRMIISQGNEEAYTQAKKSIQWAVLGVVVAILSFSIIAIVQDLLNANIDSSVIQNVDPKK